MLSLLALGLVGVWSATSVSGGLSLCCRRSRDTRSRRLSFAVTVPETEPPPNHDLRLFQIGPDPQNPDKVLLVLDAASGRAQFRLVRARFTNSDNLFWHHDFRLETAPDSRRIASVYGATVGNGGYVEFVKDQTVREHARGTLYHRILVTFNFASVTLEDASESSETASQLTLEDHRIYVSSKLVSRMYEFKLAKDKLEYTYRWLPESGQLTRVDKYNHETPIAYIIRGDAPEKYLLEVDQSLIDPTVALCTSIVFMNKS